MRGKKFNIWIAYADLFTNLTAFLLISSLGICALIGAGVLARLGGGDTAQCESLQNGIAEKLTREGSWLVLDTEDEARLGDIEAGDCTAYYKIVHPGGGDYRFKYDNADNPTLYHFAAGEEAHGNARSLIAGVCMPLWAALKDDSFDNANAQALFLARGVSKLSLAYPIKCRPEGDGFSIPPDILPPRFPRHGGSPVKAIRDCESYYWRQNAGKLRKGERIPYSDPPWCETIRYCLHGKGIGDDCQLIRAMEERDRQNTLSCKRERAARQAKLLFDLCASAPFFNDREPDSEGRPPVQRDNHRRRWRDVGFQGVMIDSTTFTDFAPDTPDRPTNTSQYGSTLRLKVQLHPRNGGAP